MVPWEALLGYLLVLVLAAVAGWLPFRLLDHISLVDRIEPVDAGSGRTTTDSRVACPRCGRLNDPAYAYCGVCGGTLLADDG